MHKTQTRAFIVLALSLLALSGCAGQQTVSPYRAVNQPFGLERLSNAAAPYGLQLWSANDPLLIGQELQLYLRPMAESYLSLYSISSSEKVYSLLENQPARSGQTLQFPGEQSPVGFRLSPPKGVETYILISTLEPLAGPQPAPGTADSPLTVLPHTPEQLISALAGALLERNQHEWNSAIITLPLYESKN
ncbi:DUF4384 domain-containing protein [Desulfogranum mediterraneum]|uniref:DUF4384 domain-containing protein n=1 Tax=Desulfogranum mediterraneum TaxID=160661 RepID=UPI000419AC5D|nr:DUF4384 domain-containing protein [Desulfogranum mediterraneum]